jgi:DNA-directed RNA polymerase subunit RPC12/RpoP
MAEHSDERPVLRCRNCGTTVAVEDAPPAESTDAGRCPKCGERTLVLSGKPSLKDIKIN